ncbi:quinone oxidoreductase family protein [Noviherbaspirillum denitrificans]|uniref:Quinone oxidoreductase n=1 Tax=Noviherbaspirillum denitrificans TaxID=1968433 RepID=A0A254T6I5_9BURK|nr:quinone oxidoreductase [Noviherbaspirillum denitrificans]OWW18274.1 quinone oxidoreductase [Noviherbaspirillum denitrificans]
MTAFVRIEQTGAPTVMKLVHEDSKTPGPGEVWIEHSAIGVNPLDVTQRSGQVPLKELPSRLGLEGVGKVTAIGDGVSRVRIGDRVGYVLGPLGAYATGRLYPAERLIKLPESLSDDDAAALLLKGITAEYLLSSVYPVDRNSRIVVYGASGAVGQFMVSWAKHLGAQVIGVVSKEASLERARSAGCDEVVIFNPKTLPEQVSEITNGKKADAVYDGLGRISFEASLNCLRPRGLMVSFGMTSGAPSPVEVSTLNSKGSLYLTRPSLAVYTADIPEYQMRAANVLRAYEDGIIKPVARHKFALERVEDAHQHLESGQSQGAVILHP